MYLRRHLEVRFKAYLDQFPCVLLLGARQVGKSTFLRHMLSSWQSFDLERPGQAALIQTDLDLFLRDHPERIWFDEAQQLPALFNALRYAIDQDRHPGRYVLSGSASPALVRGVSESLAGRVGILHLGPLCATERLGAPPSTFISELIASDSIQALQKRLGNKALPEFPVRSLWLRGGYPEPALMEDPTAAWRWFDAYLHTLSERDLRAVAPGITPAQSDRLLRMIAARHGQTLNVSSIARDMAIATRTADTYLDAIEGAFLWRRLPPFLSNIGKRLVKSPKTGLVDAGLLHHLLRIHDLQSLEVHPLLGASWEGWVCEQLIRQTQWLEPTPTPYHWRTQAGAEVDLVLEVGPRLFPIEIKHAAQVDRFSVRGLKQFLADFAPQAPYGIVVYRGQQVARLAENILLVPIEHAVL